MKSRAVRIGMLLLTLVVLAMPLTAAYAASPSQVVISDDLRVALVAALTAFFTFWFTEGIKSLSALIAAGASYFPPLKYLDISGLGSVLTAFAVSVAMYYVDQALNLIPPVLGSVAPILVQLVITLLAMGTHAVLKKFRPVTELPLKPLTSK